MTHGSRPRFGGQTALLGAVALASGACLVTDNVQYVVVNTRPDLLVTSPVEFTRVPPTADPRCSEGAMAFVLSVSDVDLTDLLDVRVVVNGDRIDMLDKSLAPTGKPERKNLVICAQKSIFSRPCNRAEFLVSSRFVGGENPAATQVPNDLDRATVWVLGPSADAPSASSEDCDALLRDGGI